MIKYSLTPALICTFLTACGGGGATSGTSQLTPIAESGYATSDEATIDGETFSVSRTPGFSVSETAGFSPETVDVVIDVAEDGESVVLTVNGVSKTLLADEFGDFESADELGILQLFDVSETVPVAVVLAGVGQSFGNATAAFIPIGFDTNPDVIAAAGGSTTYRGSSTILFAAIGPVPELDSDIAEGAFELTANFDSDRVSGSFTLVDDDTMDQIAAFALQEATISGNGFSGSFTLTEGFDLLQNPGLENADYTGRFYGTDAGGVGGSLSAVVTSDNEPDYLMQGAFIGDEELE